MSAVSPELWDKRKGGKSILHISVFLIVEDADYLCGGEEYWSYEFLVEENALVEEKVRSSMKHFLLSNTWKWLFIMLVVVTPVLWNLLIV